MSPERGTCGLGGLNVTTTSEANATRASEQELASPLKVSGIATRSNDATRGLGIVGGGTSTLLIRGSWHEQGRHQGLLASAAGALAR